jgi:hypothetical protein
MSEAFAKTQTRKRICADRYHVEPVYVPIPTKPVILFDVGLDGAHVPRIPKRSLCMLNMDAERRTTRPFTCSACGDASSTTSCVPCACRLLCDVCKTKSHDPDYENDATFGCKLCGVEYPPSDGCEAHPPMSIPSARTIVLFEWMVTGCSATCRFCLEEHPSLQDLHLHMPECGKENFRLCSSISCLYVLIPGIPHHCSYGACVAADYGEV